MTFDPHEPLYFANPLSGRTTPAFGLFLDAISDDPIMFTIEHAVPTIVFFELRGLVAAMQGSLLWMRWASGDPILRPATSETPQ